MDFKTFKETIYMLLEYCSWRLYWISWIV